MWLGVTAGPLALLVIWLFACPAQSSQVTFSDQQLTYLGTGWKTVDSPQICSQVSRTMHTTSTTGDSVSFRFIGTGVIVRGPITSRSIPLVIALDGAVQPLAAPKNCTNGCGTLYVQGNLTNSSHTLQIGYTSVSGTANLSICGISLFSNGQDPSLIPTLPISNGYGDVNPQPPAPNPTSTTPPFPPGFMEARITPSTLIGITIAVVGTVFLMVIVLFSCVVIRRRVSRNAARSRDRENSCHREICSGKGLKATEDNLSDLSRLQSWNSSRFKESLSECVIIASSAPSINPQPVASGSGTRPLSISSVTQTFIRTSHDSNTRHIYLPGLVPGTPSEHEDQFGLPSPQTDHADPFLLRYSIPIGLYSPESRPQSIIQNPFPSSGLLTPSLTTRSSVVTERDSSSNSTPLN